jgi:hypothetical protein
MECERCKKEYEKDYRKYPKGKSRFCSFECSKKRKLSEESKNKIGNSLRKHEKNFCEVCDKEISHLNNQKICGNCKTTHRKYDNKYYYVRDYRKRIKQKAVDYKGGNCSICGYSKCNRSLDFHHLEPENKSFAISSNLNRKWEDLKRELDKCILVCRNCHGEIHDNLIGINEYLTIKEIKGKRWK